MGATGGWGWGVGGRSFFKIVRTVQCACTRMLYTVQHMIFYVGPEQSYPILLFMLIE